MRRLLFAALALAAVSCNPLNGEKLMLWKDEPKPAPKQAEAERALPRPSASVAPPACVPTAEGTADLAADELKPIHDAIAQIEKLHPTRDLLRREIIQYAREQLKLATPVEIRDFTEGLLALSNTARAEEPTPTPSASPTPKPEPLHKTIVAYVVHRRAVTWTHEAALPIAKDSKTAKAFADALAGTPQPQLALATYATIYRLAITRPGLGASTPVAAHALALELISLPSGLAGALGFLEVFYTESDYGYSDAESAAAAAKAVCLKPTLT